MFWFFFFFKSAPIVKRYLEGDSFPFLFPSPITPPFPGVPLIEFCKQCIVVSTLLQPPWGSSLSQCGLKSSKHCFPWGVCGCLGRGKPITKCSAWTDKVLLLLWTMEGKKQCPTQFTRVFEFILPWFRYTPSPSFTQWKWIYIGNRYDPLLRSGL